MARRSAAPEFKTGSVVWQCWITSDGARYVWRAEKDQLLVGRYAGGGKFWARAKGRLLRQAFPSLGKAMKAAYLAYMRS